VCLATWLLDFGDLTAASAAVPHPMHWSGLVVGYLVVQAGIALQVLPGGAGLSDVGLLSALVASGVASGPAAVTVLVYRACSWLIPAVVGWVAYGVNAHLVEPRRAGGAASG
jgi:uncharacterized membrane protein YbhN (UPF0104 family)